MRPKLRSLSRYRPRVLTFLVFAVIAAMLVLANLSDDLRPRSPLAVPPPVTPAGPWSFDVREGGWAPIGFGAFNLCYGWPLIWKQCIIYSPYGSYVIGWRYSNARLAANVVIWIIVLGVPAAACEWILRRYQPRLRFSLRTLLGAICLVAILLGWFVWARDRANREDELIDAIRREHGEVWLERWGPKWLDLLGADRYRRRIVAAKVRLPWTGDVRKSDKSADELLGRLGRLPNLRYLFLEAGCLTCELVAGLGDFPQLRVLSIESREAFPGTAEAFPDSLLKMPQLRILSISASTMFSDDNNAWVAAVAKASQVDELRLSGLTIWPESLARLAGLQSLKSLSLKNVDCESSAPSSPPLLSELPVLPRLESLDLDIDAPRAAGMKMISVRGNWIGDRDLGYLARLPRLKSLRLIHADVTGAGLRQLASLKCLEELSFSGTAESPAYRISSAGLSSLVAVEHLTRLHIPIEFKQRSAPNLLDCEPAMAPEDREKGLCAWQALQQTHPGIVIDGNWSALAWTERELLPNDCDTRERLHTNQFQRTLEKWNAAGSPPSWQVK